MQGAAASGRHQLAARAVRLRGTAVHEHVVVLGTVVVRVGERRRPVETRRRTAIGRLFVEQLPRHCRKLETPQTGGVRLRQQVLQLAAFVFVTKAAVRAARATHAHGSGHLHSEQLRRGVVAHLVAAKQQRVVRLWILRRLDHHLDTHTHTHTHTHT